MSQSVDVSATLKAKSKNKHGISATKRSELFPQAMTKQEKKEIIMKQLAENQYEKTYRSKQANRGQLKMPISPDRFVTRE